MKKKHAKALLAEMERVTGSMKVLFDSVHEYKQMCGRFEGDMAIMSADIRGNFKEMRCELHAQLESIRAELLKTLRAEMGVLRAELKQEILRDG